MTFQWLGLLHPFYLDIHLDLLDLLHSLLLSLLFLLSKHDTKDFPLVFENHKELKECRCLPSAIHHLLPDRNSRKEDEHQNQSRSDRWRLRCRYSWMEPEDNLSRRDSSPGWRSAPSIASVHKKLAHGKTPLT